MPIIQLPIHLVNQIAAGEVIERPASIVKELVENALDAGATRIDLSVEDGGRKGVQVTDNGGGMGHDDAALAFAPHATSKIATEDDLFRIETMGFRGEALASIASVSHAQLRTRRAEDEAGWEVSADGGVLGQPRPCAAATGTTVIVLDLFFNTPARRKFLRTANTEFGHVTEQLARLALPRPDVAFTLRHNGRDTLNLPAVESTLRRIADLFTADLADGLLPIIARRGPVGVEGFVGPPAAARSSAKWQYLFLNGRFIRDRLLSHALREAFRGLLDASRFPVLFLFLEIPPDEVDVNVHPTKIEVRFRDSNRVYGEVLAALRETLQRSDLRPTADGETLRTEEPPRPADVQRQASLRQALADFFKSAPPPQPRLSFPEGQRPVPHRPAPAHAAGGREAHSPPPEPLMAQVPRPTEEEGEVSSPPAPLMQAHQAYIVAQDADGLVIVDQHALHERILYNDLRRRLADGRLAGQRMLIPQTLPVTPGEAAMLEESRELLEKLGIDVAPFGPNVYAVQQYPTILAERGVEMGAFLRELLDTLGEDERADPERFLEKVLAMMACKAAVKAGQPLREAEMRDLLAAAEGLDKASACPHGRPTTLRLTLRDLEKQFHRA